MSDEEEEEEEEGLCFAAELGLSLVLARGLQRLAGIVSDISRCRRNTREDFAGRSLEGWRSGCGKSDVSGRKTAEDRTPDECWRLMDGFEIRRLSCQLMWMVLIGFG